MSGFENEISLHITAYFIWPVVLCIIHILHSSEKRRFMHEEIVYFWKTQIK